MNVPELCTRCGNYWRCRCTQARTGGQGVEKKPKPAAIMSCSACAESYSSPDIQKGSRHKTCGVSPKGRFIHTLMPGAKHR